MTLRRRIRTFVLLVALLAPSHLVANHIECGANQRMEVVSYSWELRGALSWIAGFRFPTHGSGTLVTAVGGSGKIDSELRIMSHESTSDLYMYQSEIEPSSGRTLSSLDGYSFDGRQRSMRTRFDYVRRTASSEKIDTKHGDDVRKKVQPIPEGDIRDVLTSIHYIRQTAGTMKAPTRTGVFSAGKLYEVMLTPGERQQVRYKGKMVLATAYTITATPEFKKKWPGDIVVWLTRDGANTPIRIVLQQKFASLVLSADGVYVCP